MIRTLLEENPDHKFHLVGSRAVGTSRPDSDWDYAVDNNGGILSFLKRLGFTSIVGEEDAKRIYGDNKRYVKAIMQTTCVATGECIQVAIVANAKLKVRIIDAMKKYGVLRALDLSLHGTKERNDLWDALYSIAGWEGEPGAEVYDPKEAREARQEGRAIQRDLLGTLRCDDRDNPFVNVARGRDKCGINIDELEEF